MEHLGLITAFTMGLFGGVHCVAMCGGVVGVLCAGTPAPARASALRQLQFSLGYNAGRVASYAVAGALAGGLGALAAAAAPIHAAQFALKLFAGAMMLGLGLHLAGAFGAFARLERAGAPLWRRVEPLARKALPVRTPARAALLGLLWGWLPCGMVYSALVLAMGAGSAAGGALTMAAFGAGTLPTLLAMGALAGGLSRFVRLGAVRKGAGVVVAGFGLLAMLSAAGSGASLRPELPGRGGAPPCHCH